MQGWGRVLVIEDDASVQAVVRATLEGDAAEIDFATSLRTARSALEAAAFDLLIVDLTLPDGDAAALLEDVDEEHRLPTIVITGRDDPREVVRLLRLGADDYLIKPFDPDELRARVAAVMRRQPSRPALIQTDLIVIDPRRRTVTVRGRPVSLRAREFDLLVALASEPGKAFSRDELLMSVWRSRPDWQDPATVTEHVRRIRRKIEDDPDHPQLIRTVRGFGYAFGQR